MVTGSGSDESRVPQNLASGQRNQGGRSLLNHQRERISVDIAAVAADIDMLESPVSSRKRPRRCYYFTRSTP
jgi:hypothetical protein